MMCANEQTLADSRLLGDAHAWAKPAAMWIKYTLGVIIRTMRVIVYIENAHKCVKFRSYMSRAYIGEVMKKETEIEPAACETPREDAQMQVVHGADALGEGGQGRLAHKAEASGEGPQALPAYKVAATAEKAQVPAAHGVESGSLRSRKKAQSRHAIERAILELVIERGYENVIVEDVCQRAEVSKKTFFNYFSSKDAAIRGGNVTDGPPAGRPFLGHTVVDAHGTDVPHLVLGPRAHQVVVVEVVVGVQAEMPVWV